MLDISSFNIPPIVLVRALLNTGRAWGLTIDEFFILLGFDENERTVPDLARSDITREMAIFTIDEALSGLLPDKGEIASWLREPRDSLNGESPLNVMLTNLDGLRKIVTFTNDLAGRQ